MTQLDTLLSTVIEGMQNLKAKEILLMNMNKLEEKPCSNFIICQGDSNTHVSAIADSVKKIVSKELQQKPLASNGLENSQWVALDYGSVIVHIFQPEFRDFYALEHLWQDADITEIKE